MQVCEGLYQVELGVFDYDNPTGRCQAFINTGRGCCDSPRDSSPCSGKRLCDSYFTYCLRPLGSEGGDCSDYDSRVSRVNWDDGSSRDALLGLENPLILSPGPVTGGHGYTVRTCNLFIAITNF